MTRAEQMKAYKAEGHTAKEVAERFGITTDYARRICSGISPQSYSAKRQKQQDDIKAFIEERIPEFEYIGNYTGADGKADVKCRTCGTVLTRSMITIRHRNVRCRECETQRVKAKETQKRIAKEKRDRTIEINKYKRTKQLQMVICEICGEPFFTWSNIQKYCSPACRKEARRRIASYNQGSDDRLNRANIVDRDIDLKKLFDRDKGICQICGRQCDFNDCYTKENGIFIAGNDYPSKDHIIPLSMGGKHSWGNVRLAHRGCNTKYYWKNQRFTPSLGAENCDIP